MTIRDVARRAGVSAAAVSLTFSGKPGVSPATRRRIEAAAAALDWRPSPLARILASSSATHGGTVALAAAVPPGSGGRLVPDDFLAGALEALDRAGCQALLTSGGTGHGVPATVRQWWQAGRICGAVLYDGSGHLAATGELTADGVPVVTAAPAHRSPGGHPTVWWDDRTAAEAMLGYLAALGHRRVGYVADQPVRGRPGRFRAGATAHRVEPSAVAVTTGRAAEVAWATRGLLSGPRPPTAVLYDSAAGAVTGLGVAGEMGIAVPGSLSVLAWQDSPLCVLTRPRITAMAHGAADLGGHAVRRLLAVLGHRPVPPVAGGTPYPAYRDSVAPAP
ncbi:LacI family DNA-binding transcriptional regulator [Streptomyces sp. NPDC004031]